MEECWGGLVWSGGDLAYNSKEAAQGWLPDTGHSPVLLLVLTFPPHTPSGFSLEQGCPWRPVFVEFANEVFIVLSDGPASHDGSKDD